jgi:hypothetical protein
MAQPSKQNRTAHDSSRVWRNAGTLTIRGGFLKRAVRAASRAIVWEAVLVSGPQVTGIGSGLKAGCYGLTHLIKVDISGQ